MQIAVDVAGFSPAEADALRRAMGAKRSTERMEALHTRLPEGMTARGIDADTVETIFSELWAFADFGFTEPHAFSFAYLVYASAWLKAHRPYLDTHPDSAMRLGPALIKGVGEKTAETPWPPAEPWMHSVWNAGRLFGRQAPWLASTGACVEPPPQGVSEGRRSAPRRRRRRCHG